MNIINSNRPTEVVNITNRQSHNLMSIISTFDLSVKDKGLCLTGWIGSSRNQESMAKSQMPKWFDAYTFISFHYVYSLSTTSTISYLCVSLRCFSTILIGCVVFINDDFYSITSRTSFVRCAFNSRLMCSIGFNSSSHFSTYLNIYFVSSLSTGFKIVVIMCGHERKKKKIYRQWPWCRLEKKCEI